MKKIILLLLLINFVHGFTQTNGDDSTFFVQQVRDLIDQHQFASAHILLEERIQQEGLKPFFACWMVDNGLKHFYRHENYQIFYLKDSTNFWNKSFLDSSKNIRIARLRYPRRILQRIIHTHPNYACAYKLLGDYYNIQYRDFSDVDYLESEKIKELEQKIFQNYSRAVQLGFQPIAVNRWLGDYYLKINQTEEAEKFYLKNVKKDSGDAISFYRLAEISFQKKLYTRAYNYALKALTYFSPADVYLKYDALRLAAKSLLALGETEKFLYYINDCIRVIPDVQDAYIDLFEYYKSNGESKKAEDVLRRMLINNPYDLKGYRIVEQYIIESQSFFFGDSLFEEMLMKYENSDEVLANVYWSKGNVAYRQGLPSEARKFWEISRNYMRRYLPENSPLLKEVGDLAGKNSTK